MANPYGAGNQPAGWTPPSAYYAIPDQVPYVVYQDPFTGLADSGRLIDPRTKQFVYTAAGDTQGMPTVNQCVLIAWGTLKLQASVPTFVVGWENRIRSLYLNAARFLITNKLMSIVSFQTTRFGSNGVKVNIKWKDLTSGIEYPFTVTG
jgi:hypothetical protein